jgi:hypothetical protein
VHSHLSAAESSHHRNITREELLRPLSVFPFVEDVGFSKARPGSGGKRRSAKASETGEIECVRKINCLRGVGDRFGIDDLQHMRQSQPLTSLRCVLSPACIDRI